MLNVIQVSSDTNIGGAGKCILTFLKHHDRERFNVSVVLPPNSLLKPHIEKMNVKIYEIEGIADKSLSFSAINRLRKLFKEIKPDIVHTHASMSARIAARQAGALVIYTRHSVFPPPKTISKGLGKWLNGAVNNYAADRIIAVAEAAKENLVATGVSAKKISVILNGVDPLEKISEEEKAKVREQYGILPNQRVAAIVARLNEVKGHKYFAEAAKIVLDSGVDAKFIIAGVGDTANEINAQIKQLGIEDKVIMAGFVSDITGLMNVMDVQVNCSFGTEATSLSLLEGMSLGKPAVVTDFGGNPGVITDGVNGFIVPVRSPEGTAEAIIKLFGDAELYNKMSKECFEIYETRFTSEVYTRNIEMVYEQIVKNGRRKV